MANTDRQYRNGVPIEIITAAKSIRHSESGKTFFLNKAGGFTLTLPEPKAGMVFSFIVKTAPTTAYIITTDSGANIVQGTVAAGGVSSGANSIDASGQDTITFVANQAAVGDRIDVISDDTNWYVSGLVKLLAGLTFAVT